MSIIHSALKKAEVEKQKRLEPYNLSIDEIIALAEKEPAAPSHEVKRRARPHRFLWAAVFVACLLLAGLLWLLHTVISHAHSGHAVSSVGSKSVTRTAVPVPGIAKPAVRTPAATAPLPKPHPPVPQPVRAVVPPTAVPQAKTAFWEVSLSPPAQIRGYKLSGIAAAAGSNRTAVINNKLVEAGDFVGDAQVVDIGDHQVILDLHGKKFVLLLQ